MDAPTPSALSSLARTVSGWTDEAIKHTVAERAALLAFAESVANTRSGNLHGFYSSMVEDARRVVKAAGGRLDKVGRYRAGSVAWEPHSEYIDGKWVAPVYDEATDSYAFGVAPYRVQVYRSEHSMLPDWSTEPGDECGPDTLYPNRGAALAHIRGRYYGVRVRVVDSTGAVVFGPLNKPAKVV